MQSEVPSKLALLIHSGSLEGQKLMMGRDLDARANVYADDSRQRQGRERIDDHQREATQGAFEFFILCVFARESILACTHMHGQPPCKDLFCS